MNRTPEFVQLVQKVESSPENTADDGKVKAGAFSHLLTKKVSRGNWNSFTDGIRKLVRSISRMRTFLLANRKDYVNLYSPLAAQASTMTDAERDQIDYEVHVFTKNCTELLANYRNELRLKTGKSHRQVGEHFAVVLDLLEVYLKVVCGIYSQQRAIRVKRACERQRLSRLTASFSSPESMHSDMSASQRTSHPQPQNRQRRLSDNEQEHRESEVQAGHLTEEEVQLFEKENVQMYDELNSLTDEVRVIGGKVMEIAKLQEIFTENVLKQENEIDRLNSTVIASTESVRQGNDELREAIKKGAGFRVWVLFFIITLSFTVLFLDWYNP